MPFLGGIAQGFLRSVFGLGGLVLGLVLGAWNYGRIGRALMPVVHSEEIADTVGFLLIALVVMLLAGLLGALLSKGYSQSRPGLPGQRWPVLSSVSSRELCW